MRGIFSARKSNKYFYTERTSHNSLNQTKMRSLLGIYYLYSKQMVKGPGLYSDIGKKPRDLLYKDYLSDHKLNLTAFGAYSSAGIINGRLATKNFITDFEVDTKNLFNTITFDDPARRSKLIISFKVRDQRCCKIELQDLYEYGGTSFSMHISANPKFDFSGVIGNSTLALGTDLSFEFASKNFTKCNVGLNYATADFTASLDVNDMGETLKASTYLNVSPLMNTAVGVELKHNISTKEKTLTIGTQHALDPLTLIKARVNNYGKARAVVQHDWCGSKALITISGEVDIHTLEKSAKLGIGLVSKL